MITFTKKQTGLFESDCGSFTIEGACHSMRGCGSREYGLIRKADGKTLVVGSLSKCKKRADYIASIETTTTINGWEPVSKLKQNDMMEAEKGLGSII